MIENGKAKKKTAWLRVSWRDSHEEMISTGISNGGRECIYHILRNSVASFPLDRRDTRLRRRVFATSGSLNRVIGACTARSAIRKGFVVGQSVKKVGSRSEHLAGGITVSRLCRGSWGAMCCTGGFHWPPGTSNPTSSWASIVGVPKGLHY